MSRYIPLILGALLIVGLTIPQVMMTDRLSGTNVTAQQRAELLKLVPKDFGDWHGEDKPVDEIVRKTAGAIGYISRDYRNARTGERVDLWLIVGHSRDVSFHTPDVCYPASGMTARGKENALYPLVVQGLPDTPMWTNTFFKEDITGRRLVRVFWAWYNPKASEEEGAIAWEAPSNARWHFGNARALYKMYFTSEMRDPQETAEQSACVRFAREFLPEVDKALAAVYGNLNAQKAAEAAETTNSPASAKPSKPADANATESAAPSGEASPEAKSEDKADAGEKATAEGVYASGPVDANGNPAPAAEVPAKGRSEEIPGAATSAPAENAQ